MITAAPRTSDSHYTLTARTLHWLIAALVLAQIPAGLLIVNFELGPLYNLHKSFGVVILVLMLVRLGWRLGHPPPPLPADIPTAQQLAAGAMHRLLYVLLLAQAVLGWIGTASYPAPVPVFGLFNLPPIWWEDRALSDRLMAAHRWTGILIALLLAGHIGAALYHHFIRKDQVLQRMLRG